MIVVLCCVVLLSSEYLENIVIADAGIQEIHGLIEDFFEHDGQTAYIATSDHGMTNWGRLSSNGSLVFVVCGVWHGVAWRGMVWRGVVWCGVCLCMHMFVYMFVYIVCTYVSVFRTGHRDD